MIQNNDYIVLINKRKGISSFKAISEYRKENNIQKIGHAGTLDPMAEGLLIALCNGATKLSDDIMHQDKVYEVEMILGYETETLDLEGSITNINNNKFILSELEIKNIIKSFIKKYNQIPPKYSAIKINGYKLYELARSGIDIDIKKRKVNIYDIYDINIYDKNILHNRKIDEKYPIHINLVQKVIKFTCKVSSGTYIRSLVRDIAYKLGTYGTMSGLKRTQIAEFYLENQNRPIGLNCIFSKNKLILSENDIKKLSNGVDINTEYIGYIGEIINIYNKNSNFVGLAKIIKINDNISVIKKYKYFKKGD